MRGELLGAIVPRVAAPVHHHTRRRLDGLRAFMREHRHARRKAEVARRDARMIVIAAHDLDRNARIVKALQLPTKEARGLQERARVVDVARENHERHPAFAGNLHEIFERSTRGAPQPLHGRTCVRVEPGERRVEVKVGGVQEERHG